MGQTPRRIKFTTRVRRGLALLQESYRVALDQGKSAAIAFNQRLTQAQVGDFNQAIAWLQQLSEGEVAFTSEILRDPVPPKVAKVEEPPFEPNVPPDPDRLIGN